MTFHYVSNKKQLVISRYEENLSWLNQILSHFDEIIVYNKGTSEIDVSSEKIKEYKLPNVGRECHSYLHHIIENYGVLSKYAYLIFSQGNPFNHCSDFTTSVINRENYINKPYYFVRKSDEKISFFYEPIKDVHPIGLPLSNFYYHLFCDAEILKLSQSRNSLMILPTKNIRFRSINFYKHLLSFVDKTINPLEGFIIERLWMPIFDGSTKDWFTHYQEFKLKFLGIWNNIPIT